MNDKRSKTVCPPVRFIMDFPVEGPAAAPRSPPAFAPGASDGAEAGSWLFPLLPLSPSVLSRQPVEICSLSLHLESNLMGDFTAICWRLPGAEVLLCILTRTSKEIDF